MKPFPFKPPKPMRTPLHPPPFSPAIRRVLERDAPPEQSPLSSEFQHMEKPESKEDERSMRLGRLAALAVQRRYSELFLDAQALVAKGELEADLTLYTLLIDACSRFAGPQLEELAFTLLAEMKERGIAPSSAVYHYLLRVLARSANYIRRTQLLEEMKARWFDLTDDGWMSVIQGYMVDGQLEIAVNIIEERVSLGEIVSANVWRELLRHLLSLGEVDEALRIIKRFEKDAILDDNSHLSPATWYQLLEVSAQELHVRYHSRGLPLFT